MFLLIDITVECVLTYRYIDIAVECVLTYLIAVECVLTYRYNSRMCSYL